ncbi:MAG TPA: hypothetical protein VGY52_12185, partial [Roseiarcus sp.]|nr:hypothetical protein [Roseiarcus sp.]
MLRSASSGASQRRDKKATLRQSKKTGRETLASQIASRLENHYVFGSARRRRFDLKAHAFRRR